MKVSMKKVKKRPKKEIERKRERNDYEISKFRKVKNKKNRVN